MAEVSEALSYRFSKETTYTTRLYEGVPGLLTI